ncbi:UNVERIFIED_CONTAM: peroxide stress protein YaaA, partial [Bacteroidetes bacterium 56_B9]
SQAFQKLPAASQKLLVLLTKMSPEELAEFYKIKLDKAELELDRWQRLSQGQARLYPTWQLYDGLMYRYMDRRDLSKAEVDYLKK